MRLTTDRSALALVVGGLLLAGCSVSASPSPQGPTPTPITSPAPTNPAPTPSPSPVPDASPPPVGESGVTSAAQAAALVFASEPRFGRMMGLQAGLIGQSAWYEAFESTDGFTVAVTLGSGDCFAGCIDQHTWTYNVDLDGNITLIGDEGDSVEAEIPQGTDDAMTVGVLLTSGPICPVERNPPDPNCEPRPVVNAEVILRDPSGAEAARAISNEEGIVEFVVPGGAYYVEAPEVEGLLGTPTPQAFSGVGGDHVGLMLSYDTGIR